ncbi:MAG: DoxX family protein [Gammaproteobacteria bacterium]
MPARGSKKNQMRYVMYALGLLIGRILLAAIFVVSGFNKLINFEQSVAYIANADLPAPELLLLMAALIAVGYKARWAALMIFVFLIPVTYIFHAFWSVEADQLQQQMIQFQKNLAIMGGMLYIALSGPGRYSVGKDD